MSCDECLSMEFSHNSAKKELEAKIKELEEKLKKSVSRETGQKFAISGLKGRLSGRTKGFRIEIENLSHRCDKAESFIRLLDQFPMFWASTYKKEIKQFIVTNKLMGP